MRDTVRMLVCKVYITHAQNPEPVRPQHQISLKLQKDFDLVFIILKYEFDILAPLAAADVSQRSGKMENILQFIILKDLAVPSRFRRNCLHKLTGEFPRGTVQTRYEDGEAAQVG